MITIIAIPLFLIFFFFTRDKFNLLFYSLVVFSCIIFSFSFLSFYRFLIGLFFLLVLWLFYPFHLKPGLSLIFGVPGSGKTTMASYIVKHASTKKIYSNVPIKGCYKIDRNDIGKYDISGPDGLLVIDEAGIDFNNRFGNKRNSSLALNEDMISWFKLFRHYKIKYFACFSQRVDMDITIRGLADRVYLLRKTPFPWLVVFLGVKKVLTVDIPPDSSCGQLVDAFRYAPLDIHFIFSPPLWHMFDTYDAPRLPVKEFATWGFESKYNDTNIDPL